MKQHVESCLKIWIKRVQIRPLRSFQEIRTPQWRHLFILIINQADRRAGSRSCGENSAQVHDCSFITVKISI